MIDESRRHSDTKFGLRFGNVGGILKFPTKKKLVTVYCNKIMKLLSESTYEQHEIKNDFNTPDFPFTMS